VFGASEYSLMDQVQRSGIRKVAASPRNCLNKILVSTWHRRLSASLSCTTMQ